MRTRLAPLALLILSLNTGIAQTQKALAWTLQKGEQFPLTVVTAYDEKITIAGKLIKNKAKNAVGFEVTVLQAPRDGNVVLDLKITSLRAEGSQSAAAITKIGKAIQGESFSATFDHAMSLKKLDGLEALAKKITEKEGQPGAEAVIQKTLTMLFSYLIEEAFVAVPGKATAKGDTWKQTTELDAQALGTLVTTKAFTDAGPASVDGKEVRKVSIKGVLKVAPAKAGGAPALPFTVKDLDLKKQDYKGTLYFDAPAGRPVSIDTRIVTEMTMSIEVNGMSFAGEATRDQTFQIRFGTKKAK